MKKSLVTPIRERNASRYQPVQTCQNRSDFDVWFSILTFYSIKNLLSTSVYLAIHFIVFPLVCCIPTFFVIFCVKKNTVFTSVVINVSVQKGLEARAL